MKEGFFLSAPLADAAENLAREDWLMHFTAQSGMPALYLWQNRPTVVIGRNQDAAAQCDLAFAKAHGIPVVRRRTGGGAVYHDAGNLNFSIVLPRALYDRARSTGVIVSALRSFGVEAEACGRNDICVGGKKISGSAYALSADAALHHGTLLLFADFARMDRLLSVSPQKTAAHGVDSVHARVGDLAEFAPHVRPDGLCCAIRESFCRAYALQSLRTVGIPQGALPPLAARYRDDAWNLFHTQRLPIVRHARFSWGTVRLSACVSGRDVTALGMETDALDTHAADAVQQALNACLPLPVRCFPKAAKTALASLHGQIPRDVESLLPELFREWRAT